MALNSGGLKVFEGPVYSVPHKRLAHNFSFMNLYFQVVGSHLERIPEFGSFQ
jgi:hypothetical protein